MQGLKCEKKKWRNGRNEFAKSVDPNEVACIKIRKYCTNIIQNIKLKIRCFTRPVIGQDSSPVNALPSPSLKKKLT